MAGIGPGSKEDITPAVLEAVRGADVVVGYKYYFQFIEPYLKPGCQCIDTGMKRERERAEQAFAFAKQGKDVVVISSGDAGIYGMTPLIYEMAVAPLNPPIRGDLSPADESLPLMGESEGAVEIVALPGISAFQKAASLLGCPMGHDFCVLSLSDLMTPWETIERRIRAAAVGDFVTAVYNPKSHGRYWQLYRLVEIFLQEGRSEDTPVGFVRQAGREDEAVTLTTLSQFDPEEVDMFTVVIIGNSQSYRWGDRFITPRGYYSTPPLPPPLKGAGSAYGLNAQPLPSHQEEGTGVGSASKPGQQIMMQSFRTILKEMKQPDVPRWRLWPMLHAIHTTVDFGMEQCLWMDDRATETLYNKVKDGTLRHIVTDVTMAASGIRKGALDRLGIEVHCYINDPRSRQMAADRGITRSQACMRLAAEEYPEALYVVGNAPTALFEICDLVRSGKMRPAGLIAAPVGFVHVCESKHAAKTLRHIPKIIVEGRKGGSNLAATLCNAILTYDDAEQLQPGRDL